MEDVSEKKFFTVSTKPTDGGVWETTFQTYYTVNVESFPDEASARWAMKQWMVLLAEELLKVASTFEGDARDNGDRAE